jgi:dTMP kinase
MTKGIFITLEGLDGSGKTTQLKLLENNLKTRGLPFVSTCEPGGTLLGKRVRDLILDADLQVEPLSELLLFAADRAQHVAAVIRPALANNKIVISDRYADATAAYQGAGRGFDAKIIRQLIKLATNGLQPDLTFFFDLPVEQAVRRTNSRAALGQEKNRLDEENIEFFIRVREAYLAMAHRERRRFRIFDATLPPGEIQAQVWQTIEEILDSKSTVRRHGEDGR